MNSRRIIELKKERELLSKKSTELLYQLRLAGRDYENFFRRYTQTDFKMYERLPSIEGLKAYLEFYLKKDRNVYNNPNHPLDDPQMFGTFSYFDLEELAILLKTIFQFQTGKEYDVVTTGSVAEVRGLCNVYPKLHYIVGSKPAIEPFQEHNGIFYEETDKFIFDTPNAGLIAIPNLANERLFEGQRFDGIVPEDYYGRTMQYFEYKTVGEEATAYFTRLSNIFKEHLNYRVDDIQSHRDIFTFPIAKDDDFISKLLISIMIYKKSNGIKELSDDDYNIIVYSMFGETIDMSEEVDKTIPKQLTYIPSGTTRDKYKDQRF